jgi:alcohol dehydrogenase class IV
VTIQSGKNENDIFSLCKGTYKRAYNTMTSNFHLKLPPQIVFGPGKFTELVNIIPLFGKKPLVVLGHSSFSTTDNYSTLKQIFTTLKADFISVRIDAEPSPEAIDKVVAKKQMTNIDMVIAIGGGSTLDAGKAISSMLMEGGKVARFLEGVGTELPSGKKLPFIAIPTTSGTGSETTSNAVISTVGKDGFKKSLRHDNFIANLALVDPELTLSCPPKITAACGMDCFTQLVEGYLSTAGSRMTDAMALDGIKVVNRSLRRAYTTGEDLAARSDLAYGAMLSGIVLANAGLGTVHGFASAIGGLYPVPHGMVCGTLMAVANKQTLKQLRKTSTDKISLNKYTRLGQVCSKISDKTDSWYQDYFIDRLEQLTDQLNIPTLYEYGMTPTDIDTIVALTSNKNNPVQLNSEELAEILRVRILP